LLGLATVRTAQSGDHSGAVLPKSSFMRGDGFVSANYRFVKAADEQRLNTTPLAPRADPYDG
jgi:hypothetical protein